MLCTKYIYYCMIDVWVPAVLMLFCMYMWLATRITLQRLTPVDFSKDMLTQFAARQFILITNFTLHN